MQVKNRGWVKNVTIVFLSLMLVLTFFSNTIMNYSLPEVAGQNAQYGPIRTAIRGQGTVVANQSFNVEITETRQIAAVHVKAGEEIEAGQLLFTLEEGAGEEIAAAVKTLAELELALNRKLLQMRPADYDNDNREIAIMQEDLQALVDKRAGIYDFTQPIAQAKAAVKEAERQIEALEQEKADIEADIALLGSTDEYDYRNLLTEALIKLQKARTEAEEQEQEAQKAVDKAQLDLELHGGSGGGNTGGLQSQISAKQNEITNLKVAQENQKHVALLKISVDTALSTEYSAYMSSAKSLSELFSDVQTSGGQDAKDAVSAYYQYDSDIMRAESDLYNLQADYDSAVSASNSNSFYQTRVTEAKAKLTAATAAVAEAKKDFDRALRELTAQHREKLRDKTAEIKAAQAVLADAQEAKAEVEAEAAANPKPDEIDAQIKAKQREIEAKLAALARQMNDDRITQAVNNLDLEADRLAIDAQEQTVAKLKEKVVDVEVKARYGGILMAVNCVVGDKVQAGTALAAIDVAGKGYTASFGVTNEQAAKVRVGDNAVIRHHWQEVYVEIIAIRNDPESQGRRKILEFTVDGETVTAGLQLDISIGEKDQQYECVLPNSAIREDADGTFVLAAISKKTPLGTRYTAERINVTVLAKDEVNSAISRDDYNYEFIITTATKPVEAGSRIRLVD